MLQTGRVVLPLTLDAQVEEMNVEEKSNQGQWHRLWLIPETSEPLDFVSAEILDEPDVRFADEQNRVQPGVGPLDTQWLTHVHHHCSKGPDNLTPVKGCLRHRKRLRHLAFGRLRVGGDILLLGDLNGVEIQFDSSAAVFKVDYEACVAPCAVDVGP